MALLDTTTPGNIDPETLKRILAGQHGDTIDGYTYNRTGGWYDDSLNGGQYTYGDSGATGNISRMVGPNLIDTWDWDGNYTGRHKDLEQSSKNFGNFVKLAMLAMAGAGTYEALAGGAGSPAVGNGAFLGEGTASGVGAWDAAAASAGLDVGSAATFGGAGAEGMITESVGGSAGGPGSSGLLGGGEAAGGGLKTTAAMQSAMTPAGLTNATTMGTVTGGNTGFSLSNILGGMTGKDWLGAVGTAIQYADGRRQQAKAEATRATERAEDRAYNDKIREENRGWSLEDRENERAYAARQLADKQQRIGTTGGGLLGVSLKRKGT